MERPSDIQYQVLNAEMEYYLLPHSRLYLPSLKSFYLIAVCMQGNRAETNTMLHHTVFVGEKAAAIEATKHFFCAKVINTRTHKHKHSLTHCR